MRADCVVMQDTFTPASLPLPPRPDLSPTFPLGPDHALGTDFFVPLPRRSFRLARVLAIVVAICVVASVALTPVVHAWEAGRRNHEFSFMATLSGHPIRWNPCESIHYVVNPGAAPFGSLEDVQKAVLRLSSATGIAFTYDGLTDEVPGRYRDVYQPDRYGERWAPVLIGWVDPRTSSFDFDPGGREAAGVAGPLFPDPGPSTIYVSGVVAINVDDPNSPGFGSVGAQGPVVLHELAHVLGLGHTKVQGELMEPSGGGMTTFGPGDLEGLRELGRSQGCLTTPLTPNG
ncbi:MAG: hypothetical protein ABI869_04145 [Actinomycetota bacterium]